MAGFPSTPPDAEQGTTMTYRIWSAALVTLLAASPAFATEPFEGTWRLDLTSLSTPTRPSERLLKDGTFTCATCTPRMVVKADGAFHAVTDDPYADEEMVQVVDDHVVKAAFRKGGKDMGSNTTTISPDGKTMTVVDTDLSAPDGKPIVTTYTMARVAEGPSGAHVISGKWLRNKMDAAPGNVTYSWKMADGKLVFSGPGGYTYAAVPGGPAVPMVGDVGGTTVKVERVSANVMREYNYRQGKLVEVGTYTVSGDGKSMTGRIEDKLNGQVRSATAYRQ